MHLHSSTSLIQKKKLGVSDLTLGLIIGANGAKVVLFLSADDHKKLFLSLTKLDRGVFTSSSVLIQIAASTSIFTPV